MRRILSAALSIALVTGGAGLLRAPSAGAAVGSLSLTSICTYAEGPYTGQHLWRVTSTFVADQAYRSQSPSSSPAVTRTAPPGVSWFLGAAASTKIRWSDDTGKPSLTVPANGLTCGPLTASIASPADGASIDLGSVALADFACSGAEVVSCIGSVADGAALDTGSLGAKSLTVTATAWDGSTASATHHYDVVPVLPGAPTAVVAVAGDAAATVSWTAPASDGGSPLTGYVVTPYIGRFAQTPVTFDASSTSQTVTGLVNGTAYTFTVAALNAVGTGPESGPSEAVTPATVPDAPAPRLAEAGVGSATVTWTPPAFDGGAEITGYVVTPYIRLFPLAPVTFTSNATTQTVTGLAPGFTYRFRVQAINARGTSAPSPVSNPVTLPATVPGSPTIGTATAGDASATVSWSAPLANGGSPVTGYVVTPYIGFYPLAPVTFTSAATTQTVTGLTNGTGYRFRVQAINSMGTGGYSTVSNLVTPAS